MRSVAAAIVASVHADSVGGGRSVAGNVHELKRERADRDAALAAAVRLSRAVLCSG